MKNPIAISFLFLAFIFAFSSCTKTTVSTGTLTGFVTIYDQYGYKVPGDISGVSVSIPAVTGDTSTTNATGEYTINKLKTGVYNLSYTKAGCGTVLANDYSFLGGGTIYRNQTMSLIPAFSLYNVNDTIETYLTDTGVLIRGIDTVDGAARQYIIFGSTASVALTDANGAYQYNSAVQTIKAGAGTFSTFLTSQELADAGLTPGTSAYFIVYPYSVSQPTYVNIANGKTMYTALGTPSQVISVVIP